MRAAVLSATLLVLLSCGNGPEKRHALGTRHGGVFNLNETEALRSIYPLTITQAASFRIMAQVYEGLVAFDAQDLSIIPGLAERWEVDPSGTTYTFHLREGVVFHDDPAFPEGKGRTLTADDVVHCFNSICTQGIGDGAFWLFQDRVLGANAHYASSGGEAGKNVEGIEKVDNLTVRIRLTSPVSNFLQIIAHQGCWIWPRELVDAYGSDPAANAIGTGPFRMKAYVPGEAMVLERSAGYWGVDAEGHQLPYLDAVRITFVTDKTTEFREFTQGHLSAMLELPVEHLADLRDSVGADGAQRFTMLMRPALTSQYFGFNARTAPFKDVRVRRAFALAIDRRFLVDSVLGGMAEPAAHGIVAPGLEHYPYALVPGVPFAPDSARKLLTDAGFPNGEGFPPVQLQLNADGFGYLRVAEAVQAMYERELHVPVSISVVTADRHWQRVDMGQALLWRDGWTADHPDPENFLALLYGKNAVLDTTLPASINKPRYFSEDFDAHFAKAAAAHDEGERMHELAAAEAITIVDMPVAPLYHERAAYLVGLGVQDLHLNAIEYLSLRAVWLRKGPL